MKRLFDFIAAMMVLSAVVSIIVFMTTYDLVSLLSAVMGFVGSYAWATVGEMWESIHVLEEKVRRLERL